MQKIDKQFVSKIDKKLAEFNKTHPKSAAQQAEIEKYKKIYELRDNPDASRDVEKDDLWS